MSVPAHSSREASQGSRLRRSAKDVVVIGMPCLGMAISRENAQGAYGAGRNLLGALLAFISIT